MNDITKSIIEKINCPHRVFERGSQGSDVMKAYIEALERGEKEGFVPALVVSDEHLAEWFSFDENEEGHSKEKLIAGIRGNGKAMLDEWFKEYSEYLGDYEGHDEEIREMLEEMDEYEDDDDFVMDSFVSYNDYSGKEGETEETILFEIPVKNPWEVIAWIPMGGWNECPAPDDMMEICKYWYEKNKAYPAVFTHDVLEFYVKEPITEEKDAMEMAKEHYAFCNDRVDQGTQTGTIQEVADSLMDASVWYFWWD